MLLLLTICFLLVLIFQLMQLFPMLQNFVVIVVVEWNNFSSMCKNANKFLAIIILAAFIKLRYNYVVCTNQIQHQFSFETKFPLMEKCVIVYLCFVCKWDSFAFCMMIFFFYSFMFHCVAGRVLLIDVMAKAIARNNSKNFINIILNEIYTRKLSSAVCRVDHH